MPDCLLAAPYNLCKEFFKKPKEKKLILSTAAGYKTWSINSMVQLSVTHIDKSSPIHWPKKALYYTCTHLLPRLSTAVEMGQSTEPKRQSQLCDYLMTFLLSQRISFLCLRDKFFPWFWQILGQVSYLSHKTSEAAFRATPDSKLPCSLQGLLHQVWRDPPAQLTELTKVETTVLFWQQPYIGEKRRVKEQARLGQTCTSHSR